MTNIASYNFSSNFIVYKPLKNTLLKYIPVIKMITVIKISGVLTNIYNIYFAGCSFLPRRILDTAVISTPSFTFLDYILFYKIFSYP